MDILKACLLHYIENDSEIREAISNVFGEANYEINDSNQQEINLRNEIYELKNQLQIEKEGRLEAENNIKKIHGEYSKIYNEFEKYKNDSLRELNEKKRECNDLKLKYNQYNEKINKIIEGYNYLNMKYRGLDLIYKKYLSLNIGIVSKLERVLNDGKEHCDSVEKFFAYGIQESNIIALWESIATNLEYYNSESQTKILIDIFEYFINLYKEVSFKSVVIDLPNEGEMYDERIHTRTSSSGAVGKIQEILLPGFSIGKNISKKSLVVVK